MFQSLRNCEGCFNKILRHGKALNVEVCALRMSELAAKGAKKDNFYQNANSPMQGLNLQPSASKTDALPIEPIGLLSGEVQYKIILIGLV